MEVEACSLGHRMCMTSAHTTFQGYNYLISFTLYKFLKSFPFAPQDSPAMFHVIEWKTYTEKKNAILGRGEDKFFAAFYFFYAVEYMGREPC